MEKNIYNGVCIKENERIDDLEYKRLRIIQNIEGFCFGIDSVLLSDFAKEIKKGSKVIDLGTGTGILPILLCGKTELENIIGVEIQKEVAEMAERSSCLNNLQDRFKIINTNIRDLSDSLNNCFDVVVSNPPYKKPNSGAINENKLKLISRHEIEATLEDFIETAQRLLKNNGSLYMVHRPERLSEIISLLKKKRLEPKVIRFVYSNLKNDAKLVLIKAVKNAKEFVKIEKPLIIYNEKGEYTDEILKIYNK